MDRGERQEAFDTLSVMGIDEDGSYFVRLFENHRFYRRYRFEHNDQVWTLSGDHERASIKFMNGGRAQVVKWEWKQDVAWLLLCDRTAIKVD